ncbi:MAG TPA: SDR family NAD(P)-dependent oxidoreductase [Actinobacteria bacterium]|nr:SDR family NAD(P)-dependent oxidoreductase [Actinomycetota bacterium]
MDVSGAAALVSGGASGLGAATARALGAAGASVTILDVADEAGEALAAELGARYVHADVTDPDEVAVAVDVAAEDRPLRVVVNCAGVGDAGRILDRAGSPLPLDRYRRVVEINLVGTFNVLRLAAARMAEAPELDDGERGVIVNTASVAAFEGQIGQIAYSASKGGVVGMTVPAARDLASVGIRVNTIAPGIIDTPLLAGLNEDYRRRLAEGVPFPRRLGRPEEFAELVMAIVRIGYLNGATIRLDGALRMAPR